MMKMLNSQRFLGVHRRSIRNQSSSHRSIHTQSSSHRSSIYNCNRIISDHIRAGDLASALQVFHNMEVKSTVTWNSILSGYSKQSLHDAQNLFDQIPHPDSFSYNTMLNCYVSHRMTKKALHFFNTMPVKDASSWNIIIKSFVQAKNMTRARQLFDTMPQKTAISWNAMISGYIEAGDLDSAESLFDSAPSRNVVTWTAMINGYMKRGDSGKAEKLFDEMPERNLVSWNAMIAGYVHNCKAEEGVMLFKAMLGEGIRPNQSTFSSALHACSELACLNLGKQVHQVVIKSPLSHDTTAGTSVVGMYGKCGELANAWKQFSGIANKDVVSWNAIISAYAQHGEGKKALQLFDEMGRQQTPDAITLVAVMVACDHAGLVDLGEKYFTTMKTKYKIKPNREHYTCMINLLGRAGKISEAFKLIESMPYEAYPALYGSLLGACRVHKNPEMAEIAAGKLLEVNPGSASAYVELANVYAAVGDWEAVGRVRKQMKEEDVVKTAGYSWIEIGRVAHRFRSGEMDHVEIGEIRAKVREVDRRARVEGYVADVSCALRKVGDEEKREILMHHSERLAVAYGLMKLPRRTTIQVFKNLRICTDCHTFFKYLSLLEKRQIMVRDCSRFHLFKFGHCSCADYW